LYLCLNIVPCVRFT